jgi:hypothetical protein
MSSFGFRNEDERGRVMRMRRTRRMHRIAAVDSL